MLLVNWKPGFRIAVWMNGITFLMKLRHTPLFLILNFLLFLNSHVLGDVVLT